MTATLDKEKVGAPVPEEMDTSQRLAITTLIGVYAAVNAIPDAYVLVDAPDCAHLKTQFIHGNHDWMSTLVSISGFHRVANTALHCWKVIDKRDVPLMERLRRIGDFEGSGLVMITSMPMATITGIDYDRLCSIVQDETGTDTFHIRDRAIDGDWIDGFSEVLQTLAKRMPIERSPERAIEKDPKKVAIVGYFMDRNEEDHHGNLRELRRLLKDLGLELSTVWVGGEPWADMKRGVQEAGTILSFPYVRKAAKILGRRLKTPVVECELPFGLKKTIGWLEQLGEHFGLQDRAREIIEREMRAIAPRLEFIVPFQFLHRSAIFIGDPHLSDGFLDIAEDIGMKVPLLTVTARVGNSRELREAHPGTEVLIDPRMWGFLSKFGPLQGEADIVISSNTTMSQSEEGYLEFGFPSYERHALYDRPFLGFGGFMAFLDDVAHELRRVDQAKLKRQRDRMGEDTHDPGGPGGPGSPGVPA